MALPYYSNAEARPLTRVLKWEVDPIISRETGTLLAGDSADRTVDIGTVLGKRLFDDPVITPDGGNTGDGALGTLTLGAAAKAGTYVVTCIAEAANAGTFQVVDPDGFRLPDATVAVAYSNPQIGFTISDGATDWAIGDVIEVEVPAGDGKLVTIDFTATDGSQRAHAVAATRVTAPDGVDAGILTIRRQAVLARQSLIWPEGATDGQKEAALAELAASTIITLTEA